MAATSGRISTLSRWIRRIALTLLTVAWMSAAWIYLASRQIITHQYVPDVRNLASVTDPDLLEEGERLAQVYGCYGGCHGDRMQGAVIQEHPLNGRLVAPNLTQSMQRLSLPELEAIVRQGIRADGTSVFGMPSASFAAMTDRELSAILSFIRRYPLQSENYGQSDHGLLTRWRMVSGALPAEAEIRYHQPWRETFRGNENRLGEYLAVVACAQCHGQDLEGSETTGAPSLDRVHDYDRFEFRALMEEGVAPGAREVGGKRRLASARYSRLTDDEIDALMVFLKTRP